MEEFHIFWNRYDDKFKCLIGILQYDDGWTFKYDKEGVSVASQLGFTLFPEFPDIDRIYKGENLFTTFDIRIRRMQNAISEDEKVKLLENTEGSLVTDHIKIIKKKTLGER